MHHRYHAALSLTVCAFLSTMPLHGAQAQNPHATGSQAQATATKTPAPKPATANAANPASNSAAQPAASGAYRFTVLDGTRKPLHLSAYAGKPLLIVNTASQCGFTPQFAGLEALHQRYASKGLVVLAFPSNEFGGQDPGSDAEIADFAHKTYAVTFPIMAKTVVNGTNAHPLFQWLKTQKAGVLGSEDIKWNFTKFLVDRNGQVVKRYGSMTEPQDMAKDIERVL